MFWRIAGSLSLAARLTAWFGGAFVLLLAGWSVTVHQTVRADVEAELPALAAQETAHIHAHRAAFVELADDTGSNTPYRILGPDGVCLHESPLLARHLPADLFPPSGGWSFRVADGTEYQLCTQQVDGWTYHFALDRTDPRQLVHRIYRRVAMFLLPVLGLALVAGYLVARAGLRPLRRMAAAMRGLGPDRLDQRVPTGGLPAELADVAGTFNRALDRIAAAFGRLDQFAADVAHEARTPVHALRTAAEVALRADRPPDDYRRTLAEVADEADRLTRLIDRLLLLARVSDPRAALDLEPVAVAAELEAVRDFFEPVAAEAGVAVAVAAPHRIAHRLDRALFQRALSNLTANAIAHTPPGGTVVLRAAAAGGRLTVEVADTGRGIPAEALPRLFDRYYRPPGADRGGGLGLGLAIVKRVAELHGGAVAVESRLGAGTTVRLDLPPPA